MADLSSHPKQISYKHGHSKFLNRVRRWRSTSGRAWEIVNGLDILLETAYVQFEFWTGYRAPQAEMRRAVYSLSDDSDSTVAMIAQDQTQ